MGELRIVKNRHTSELDRKSLSVYEGVNLDVKRHIQTACRRENDVEIDEKVVELAESCPERSALYSLGKRATLHALAALTWEAGKDAPLAELGFVRFYRAPGADGINDEDELAFIRAVHVDVRDDRQPPLRRYEGGVVVRVATDDLARQALYARAGYADFGLNDTGDKKVLIRRY